MLEKNDLSLILSVTDIACDHRKLKIGAAGCPILYWVISKKAEKEDGNATDTSRSNGSEKNSRK